MNDDDGIEIPADLEIRVGDGTGTELYRTCPECGRDLAPEPFEAGREQGFRFAFNCPDHGLHSVVDPFEGSR